jgi:hypothetical protein
VAWILRLVETGAEGEDRGTDLLAISRPDGPGDVAHLGLTLSEAKQLLASVQREIVAAQARDHVVALQLTLRSRWNRINGLRLLLT